MASQSGHTSSTGASSAGGPRPTLTAEGLVHQVPDIDPEETQDWLDSLDELLDEKGKARARFVMLQLLARAREKQVGLPALRSSDYVNTIPPEAEPWFPGDEHVERRLRAYIRWNAAIMVSKANRKGLEVGGHIATYQSAASLYEVGFNHFFRGKDAPGGGDQVFIQGHASPGIYARAYLEGRLSADQLDGFRQEVSRGPGRGLSSYPHPRLMPEFWEFPTVSMGLTGINSIYQARFNRYLRQPRRQGHLRPARLGLPRRRRDGRARVARRHPRRVARGAGQPHLGDQLQPAAARRPGRRQRQGRAGAGVVLPRRRLARDQGPVGSRLGPAAGGGRLRRPGQQDEHHARRAVPDLPGRGRRLHPPELLRATRGWPKMVANFSDEQLKVLSRGGHDYRKVYAAFKAASEHVGQPTVILAQTVKGWTIDALEGKNATHQMKKLTTKDLKAFRDRLYLEIPDSQLEDPYNPPYFHPGQDNEEIQYLQERRRALGGYVPERRVKPDDRQAAGRRDVRPADGAGRRREGRHDAGLRPAAARPDARQGDRPADRADRAGRVPDVRHGLDVPDGQDLQPARADVRVGRPQAAAVVQGGQERPAPARGHLRGRGHGLHHRRGLGLLASTASR